MSPPAGYSGTPLPRKLGIKPGHRVALLGAPPGFSRTMGRLPEGVEVRRDLRGRGRFDVMLAFFDSAARMRGRFAMLARRLERDGGLWISWPKKASGRTTDLTEAIVRGTGLEAGLVDNKICAVDAVWSGLRFVYRLEDR